MSLSLALFDLAIWPMLVMIGGIIGVILFPGVVLVEAVLLRALKWKSFWVALLDAFLMNVVTALIGLALPSLFLVNESLLGMLVGLGIAWVLSTGIEGLVLMGINALRKENKLAGKQLWLGSLAANSASYLLLGSVMVLFMLGGEVQ